MSGKPNDNWNPADVWIIDKTFDFKKMKKTNEIQVLNDQIREGYYNRELYPISLKHITSNKASTKLIDSEKYSGHEKLDFSITEINLTESFNNLTISTKCGFEVRCSFKSSAQSIDVSVEGKMKNSGSHLGAIDSKLLRKMIKETRNYDLRSGRGPASDTQKAKNELKEIMKTYRKVSISMKTYNDIETVLQASDDFRARRFANLISYMYALTILSKNKKDNQEILKNCYLLAKKLTKESSLYLLVQNH